MKKYALFLLVMIFCSSVVNAQENESTDRILKNGFWFDFGLGFSRIYKEREVTCHSSGNNPGYYYNCYRGKMRVPPRGENHYSFSLNLGNKWYYPMGKNYQLGFQVTWIGGGFDIEEGGYLDIGAIGFCSLLRLNKNTGIEANLNIGPTVYMNNYGYIGAQVNLGLRYRVGYFTVGTTLRYSMSRFSQSLDLKSLNLLLSLGCKF